MEKKRGKLSGHLLRGLYMDFNHQKLLVFSMRRAVTENCPRLLSRQREEPKLQGMHPLHRLQLYIYNHHHYYTKIDSIPSMLIAYRLRELHTLKGHVESVVKLKGLDIDTIQQHYTV
jgi:hypothetical protein